MNEPEITARSKCALTNRQVCCYEYVDKGTGNQNSCGVSHSLPLLQNVLDWAGVSPGPSCFALRDFCLYDTVVFWSNLRQGIW